MSGVNDILGRLAKRYQKMDDGKSFATTPTLLVLTNQQWSDYIDSLTPEVVRTYVKHGYYWVTAGSRGSIRDENPNRPAGVRAISYKGVPAIHERDLPWCLENRDQGQERIMALQ